MASGDPMVTMALNLLQMSPTVQASAQQQPGSPPSNPGSAMT